MTEWNDDDQNQEPDPDARASLPVEDLRNLRAAAKAGKEATQRAESAERELAVVRAGLDLSPTQLKALQSVHEGEWQPEALKVTATELGFVTPPPQVGADQQHAEERITAASVGAGVPDGQPDWDNEYAQAGTEAEVLAIARRKGTPIVGDEN